MGGDVFEYGRVKELDEGNIPKASMAFIDDDGMVWDGPMFPVDHEAKYTYFSRMGGFVPTQVAGDTIFTNPLHYGAGGFEGIRIMRTPYGDGFIELPHNVARFVYSSMAFNLSLMRGTMDLFDDSVDHVEHLQRTPREFFADSEKSLENGNNVGMGVSIFYKDGRVVDRHVPFKLMAKFLEVNDNGERTIGDREVTLREMEAAVCSLAFLNKLVSGPPFPEGRMDIIKAGYFRPVFWISGEEGLKVPTVMKNERGELVDKPIYYGIGTLPWGLYLSPEGYARGLNLLVAPLHRIDESMPVKQKIAGDYVNSARNKNIALRLGFDEVLALNHNEEVVEGSAENIIVLFTNRNTGAMRAYCPPLSSNILAGTTRDRMLKVLESGVSVSGRKVELVVAAPKLSFVLDSLEGKTVWEVSAIVLMGTGAGIVHARSLTHNSELKKWMEVNEFRSEEQPSDPLVLRRLEETKRTYLINKGERHPFVVELEKAYTAYVLGENGSRITPAYSMDYRVAAERVFGVDLEEVAGRDFVAKMEWGYFRQKFNGITQPDEITARCREADRTITKMNEISMGRRSKPVEQWMQEHGLKAKQVLSK